MGDARLSARMKALYRDPERHAAFLACLRTPQARRNRSEARRKVVVRVAEALWAGPMDETLKSFFVDGKNLKLWKEISQVLGVCEPAARRRARFLGLIPERKKSHE